MHGILYEESSIWQFLLVTCVLGGWAAWMTARGCALSWRPYPAVLLYMLLLACAVRFIHYALFEGTLLSAQFLIVDAVVLMIIGSLGFRYTRTNQMTSQYHWLYEKTSAFGWKARA